MEITSVKVLEKEYINIRINRMIVPYFKNEDQSSYNIYNVRIICILIAALVILLIYLLQMLLLRTDPEIVVVRGIE